MPRKPFNRDRRSVRLPGYDYASPGEYFMTLVCRDRTCLFGEIVDGELLLNQFGEIVRNQWQATPRIRPSVEIDAFVIMPNHLHGIIVITEDAQTPIAHVGAHCCAPDNHAAPDARAANTLARPSRSLGSLVAGFKAASTRRVNGMRVTPGVPVWQRNYFEHIIRDERALERIREYIAANPGRWTEDAENPFDAQAMTSLTESIVEDVALTAR